jgi:hypothetical protein
MVVFLREIMSKAFFLAICGQFIFNASLFYFPSYKIKVGNGHI